GLTAARRQRDVGGVVRLQQIVAAAAGDARAAGRGQRVGPTAAQDRLKCARQQDLVTKRIKCLCRAGDAQVQLDGILLREIKRVRTRAGGHVEYVPGARV